MAETARSCTPNPASKEASGEIVTRSQEVAVKAILARFVYDRPAAILYCGLMAHDYPELADEYREYQTFILEKK